MMKICQNLKEGNVATIMKDFTAKEQIFLLDIMIGNLWLFLDRTSLFIFNMLSLKTFNATQIQKIFWWAIFISKELYWILYQSFTTLGMWLGGLYCYKIHPYRNHMKKYLKKEGQSFQLTKFSLVVFRAFTCRIQCHNPYLARDLIKEPLNICTITFVGMLDI